MKTNHITVFEHDKLLVSPSGFNETKMKELLKLNEFHGGKYLDGLHNGVKFKQYVGVIQIDGLVIEILPKTDDRDKDKWRDVLVKMLLKTGKLKANTIGAANLRRQKLNLLDIYFEYFLNEVQLLQRRGLIKKYRKETKNLYSLKGKLEMSMHLQKNIAHKEKFYTTHQVYDTNHALHQIIKVALDIVKLFTPGSRLNDQCNRVLFNFPLVDHIKVNEQLFESVNIDRKTSSYSKALALARLIILNYSPDIARGKTKMISILFDMNSLWENYVISELRKVSVENSIEVIVKSKREIWEDNNLQPDIVLVKENRNYIIDTKWKRPGFSPSSTDIRQVYAYARFWNAERVMLLYPGVEKTEFKSFLNTDNDGLHQCKMGFVSVLNGKQLSDDVGIDVLKAIGLLDS